MTAKILMSVELTPNSQTPQKAPIIGVDAEWKPAMGLLQKTRLSLIQMATRDKVYLFDVLKLSETITPEDWGTFNK